MLLDDKAFVLWSSEGVCLGGGVHLLDYNVSLLHQLVEGGVFQEVDVGMRDWEGLADQTLFAASGRGMMQVGYHGDDVTSLYILFTSLPHRPSLLCSPLPPLSSPPLPSPPLPYPPLHFLPSPPLLPLPSLPLPSPPFPSPPLPSPPLLPLPSPPLSSSPLLLPSLPSPLLPQGLLSSLWRLTYLLVHLLR